MKNSIILFFTLLLGLQTPIYTQLFPDIQLIDDFIIIDSTRFVVQYSFEWVVFPDKPENLSSDITVLEIGTRVSKSYSYGVFMHDSIATANIRASGVPSFGQAVEPVEVFKNHPIGINTIIHRTPFNRLVFLYEDDMTINWQILPERKEIMGYSCQKATATFRGRSWEAWFTNQIPVSDGPWKFQGLPGLILEVSDSQNHFSFSCIGLSRKTVPIKKYKWKYERTTREKVNQIMTNYADRPYQVGKQMGIRFGFINEAHREKTLRMKYTYYPIELE